MTSAGPPQAPRRYEAILFDLLTALLDSWTVWDAVAGSVATGRAWRAAYLRRTYGCGAYRRYEMLVEEAAVEVGLDARCVAALDANWSRLAPWPGVVATLRQLTTTHRLGIVTNCSERLGQIAARCVSVPFEVVITSERAGFYKPDPAPYRLALEMLGLPPQHVLFVAGSGYDLFGTAKVGLDTFWHNRIGLAAPPGAPPPLIERPDLDDLPLLAVSSR